MFYRFVYFLIWSFMAFVVFTHADGVAIAQDSEPKDIHIEGPIVTSPVEPVTMDDDLSRIDVDEPSRAEPSSPEEVPIQFPQKPPSIPTKEYSEEPPLMPHEESEKPAEVPIDFLDLSPPILNFDGIKLGDPGANFIPPDTNGDVGPNHYIQTVNSSMAIFDKEGTTLAGPMPINTLFAPLGGPCSGPVIDPIVNYDHLADRWIVMGLQGHICVAVSQTSDPVAGGWFLYAFDLGVFSDYPKLGVWPDAYYLGINQFPSNVIAIDRNNMLIGNPAGVIRFNAADGPFILPADLDGRPPKPDTPAPFVRPKDGDIWGGVDHLQVFEFSADFEKPSESTFNLVGELPTDPFSAILCKDWGFGNCAEQPNGIKLATLPFFIMWRLQYRHFSTHEAMVVNHTIDVDPISDEKAGIRWYELRKGDGIDPWTIFQEGTFAPQPPDADAFLHRWMGSIAMDKKGNIALGFSASSATRFPDIRYVGRLRTDIPNHMPQGEPPDGDFIMFTGAGSQNHNRWGDYSSMSIDPIDGCTFWYTQEYIDAIGRWRTRIGTFSFSSCINDECLRGDLDCDGDVDRDDLDILLKYRNLNADHCPECDLDRDGRITALDARKLTLMCTNPGCAVD